MRVPRRNHGPGGIFEPNMTPLIDVSLVLVVILMVATPMAFQSGISVHAAGRSGKQAEDQRKAERIELSVRADGRIAVNRTVVESDSLDSVLRPLLAQSPSGLVVVTCDDAVPHGRFVSILDAARQLGARRIAVVGGV